MNKILICRFESEKDLSDFNSLNGTSLTNYTTDFNLVTKEEKLRKTLPKKYTPKNIYPFSEWWDMPFYHSEKQEPYAKINFIYDTEITQLEDLCAMFNQNVSSKSTSVWFPKLIAGKHAQLRVVEGSGNGEYPIYVVSKGRWDKCSTSRFLSQMEVEHYVVVEPSEYDKYMEHTANMFATILELDMSFKDNYDTFDNLGDSKSKGPGGARNFCWQHSIDCGFDWHWVMDDNAVEGFHYMYKNQKVKCRSGAIFKAMEDFVNRYSNIGIAGMNYSMFCKMTDWTPPFVMNTRIYSFLLIRNDIPYRWRGRYNEDTDLSLRVLKDGWCTVQFNAFLAGKATTQKVGGGNTEEFYAKEGTLPKSKMLEDMHPDVAKVVWKFNRWHHQVDYTEFKQELILKDDIAKNDCVNNYGMKIINTEEEDTFDSKSYLEFRYSDEEPINV